ncbi:6-phosphogluconolactonase [Thiopseudomonas alkaliphila]|uniref:6-phosphogluconolactonase n=1 Tax=Thiopseudomonas alkaliphila TaxID=1697053 RepID=UPI0025781F3E|nr:6-phosphogluconolactonase [Thiopseudomonas alkaliphila]MDM1717249.1 6-phosphogluconolactonase [Thiopseudomonas alkaliphila]
MSQVNWQIFTERDACSKALAQALAKQLQAPGLVFLPGGSTPKLMLTQLAQQPTVDWSQVVVSATDERWVAADAESSNFALLSQALPAAQHLDPRQQQSTPEQAVVCWQRAISQQLPSRATVLGMGEDGHFASLFPGMPNLDLVLNSQLPVAGVVAAAPSEPKVRLSLNLTAYYQTNWLAVLIFGESKKAILEQALAGNQQLPISHFIQQSPLPITIYWAP